MFARITQVAVCFAVGMSFGLGAVSAAETSQTGGDEMTMLQSKLDRVEQRATRVADINAVKKLQRAYGYYIDKGLWDQAADLFAKDGTIEVGLDGVYVGKKRVRAYLRAMGDGKEGLAEGRLNEHIQLMPFITVAPDGKTAKGRWRGLLLLGKLGKYAWWGEGPYENDYVKENGVWKIRRCIGIKAWSSITWAAGRRTRMPIKASGSRTNCRPTGRRRWPTRPGRQPSCHRSISPIR
jgi:hypothetical protein